jgi:hypothetical protein
MQITFCFAVVATFTDVVGCWVAVSIGDCVAWNGTIIGE